jgi:hypothetical protein
MHADRVSSDHPDATDTVCGLIMMMQLLYLRLLRLHVVLELSKSTPLICERSTTCGACNSHYSYTERRETINY